MATYHVIGQPTRRVDGKEKATGHARYAADVSLPGTLWGKSLHSPYAHARIVRLDTTAAQQVPGVHAVITGADVRGGLWGRADRKSTRLNSSHLGISYAVFCLKKKKQ